ncbi:MAG TPA: NAD-dependent epimerase/dehydratase family protein [Acetobacteraceae bacterium]|nr:NAD-dependent epimerase/dehydratase family protein [Acetobacteraceae bacterium]
MRRAIVTGADGFLGRHLVDRLGRNGVQVTTVTRRHRPSPGNYAMGDAPWCSSVLASVIECAEPDAVFHLVGGTVGSQAELEQSNVGVALSVMQALREARARPLLVCCGSAAEYGAAARDGEPVRETAVCAPLTSYGVVKHALTKAALGFADETGAPVLIARVFNPIGPGMPPYLALGGFARQIAQMRSSVGVLQTGNLEVFRDFINVDHVTEAMWLLACNDNARGVVNVCSGQATELGRLVDILVNASEKDVAIATSVSRLRVGELRVMVGSTELLANFGAAPPATDYTDLIERIWHDARERWSLQ